MPFDSESGGRSPSRIAAIILAPNLKKSGERQEKSSDSKKKKKVKLNKKSLLKKLGILLATVQKTKQQKTGECNV